MKKMKKRRDFLKEVCPTVAFAFFGISFLEACSSASDDDVNSTLPGDVTEPGNGSGDDNGSGDGGGSSNNGFSQSGNVYTINISHSNFSSIQTVGGWMNAINLGIPVLLLRLSQTEVGAYTNVCPHAGANNEWELRNGNIFRCNRHGNSYSTNCNSGLTCYSTTPIQDDSFTMTLS